MLPEGYSQPCVPERELALARSRRLLAPGGRDERVPEEEVLEEGCRHTLQHYYRQGSSLAFPHDTRS